MNEKELKEKYEKMMCALCFAASAVRGSFKHCAIEINGCVKRRDEFINFTKSYANQAVIESLERVRFTGQFPDRENKYFEGYNKAVLKSHQAINQELGRIKDEN